MAETTPGVGTQFKFKVIAPQSFEQASFMITVRIEVPDKKQSECTRVLHYIRNAQIKDDLMNSWIRENAAGYGMEIKGGPRPVFENEADRSSPVVAYEQDFKLTRPI